MEWILGVIVAVLVAWVAIKFLLKVLWFWLGLLLMAGAAVYAWHAGWFG